jgi:hypothetical protein
LHRENGDGDCRQAKEDSVPLSAKVGDGDVEMGEVGGLTMCQYVFLVIERFLEKKDVV